MWQGEPSVEYQVTFTRRECTGRPNSQPAYLSNPLPTRLALPPGHTVYFRTVCLSAYLPDCVFRCLPSQPKSVCPFFCLSAWLGGSLLSSHPQSVCLSVLLPTCLTVCFSAGLASQSLSCLSFCLPACLTLCLSGWLSGWLSDWLVSVHQLSAADFYCELARQVMQQRILQKSIQIQLEFNRARERDKNTKTAVNSKKYT